MRQMRSRGLSRRAGKIPAGCARITQLLEIGVCCCIQMQDQRCCLKRPEHLPLGKLDAIRGKPPINLWEQVKEVNAAFFRIAGALGFGRVLEAFRAQLRSDLMEAALNGNSSVR
jgi:hypothetical protein